MDMRKYLPDHPSDDEEAKRWRGHLFQELRAGVMWRDKDTGFYEMLDQPKSVTFPICACCGRVVWNWPHYEEPVPDNAICELCANDL